MLRTLTISYFALLLVIVISADLGLLAPFSEWLHQVPFGDKGCHFLLVGTLSFLTCVTLSCGQRATPRWLAVAGTVVVLALLTSMEELSQVKLSHRQFSQTDLICNVAGAVIFGPLALLLPVRCRHSNASSQGFASAGGDS